MLKNTCLAAFLAVSLSSCAGSIFNPAGSTNIKTEVDLPDGRKLYITLYDVKDRGEFYGTYYHKMPQTGEETKIDLGTKESSASNAIAAATEANKALSESVTKTVDALMALLEKAGFKAAAGAAGL